jgi:hypothetical protein
MTADASARHDQLDLALTHRRQRLCPRLPLVGGEKAEKQTHISLSKLKG